MLARIRTGKRIINQISTPTITFNESSGKIILNITIELPIVDPDTVPAHDRTLSIVDDMDRTQDPVIKQRFRDASLGVNMLAGATKVRSVQITSPNSAEGASTLTITADLGTKLPGTGSDVARLKEERKANFKLMQEQPDPQYENGEEILST
jgi:hypothetical protein